MKTTFKKLLAALVALAVFTVAAPMTLLAQENGNITVYLSLSKDGVYLTSPITGQSMARVPVEIAYTDLAEYGLEKYYRCEADTYENGGGYINSTVIEQPTVLQLYIKAAEEYYLGRKYNPDTDSDVLSVSGNAASAFITNFWGENASNSVFFADHTYQEMGYNKEGGYVQGACCDYVLLEDGMCVDMGIFSNYAVWSSGYFAFFDKEDVTAEAGDTVNFRLMGTSASAFAVSDPVGLDPSKVTVFKSDDTELTNAEEIQNISADGSFSITFDTPGTYYLSAFDNNMGDTDTACIAPASAKVTVTEQKLYDVTVQTAPSDTNVKFYNCAGFGEDNRDILGDEITAQDGGISDGFHTYTMSLPKGTYSFRGTDADGKSLGGTVFEVPENTASQSFDITLRELNTYTNTKPDGTNYASSDDYTSEVTCANGKKAVCGEARVNDSGYTVYPYLLPADADYSIQLIPSKALADSLNYGANTVNYTLSKGSSAASKCDKLIQLINSVITAPQGSKVQVFRQVKNYLNEEIQPVSQQTNGDTLSCTYQLPSSNSSYTYRVSKSGKITKAGYLDLSSEENAAVNITFAEDENPSSRVEYDTSTGIGKRMEDNILLNINNMNCLRMSTGDTFKARALRAWQIINSDTGNIIIEPDFHYSIISGDSVSVEQEGNCAVLTAVKSGVSIVKVTYDAIEIGGKTSFGGLYGAVAPEREGLFIVNVDGDKSEDITMPDWDSDMDTVYFTENNGQFTFKPECSAPVTVTCNGSALTADENGSFTAPINEGNNIIKVSSGSTEEYMVVKGSKVSVITENLTNPGTPVKQGDRVSVSFKGLHMPMPKLAGLYNPGFGKTMKTAYETPQGGIITSGGAQYDFINNNSIEFTAYECGELTLTGGRISMSSMGSPKGAHREIGDNGIGTNFAAAEVKGEFSLLPDITVNVEENSDLSYIDDAKANCANLSSVVISCGSSFPKSFSISKKTEKQANVKNINATFSSINPDHTLTVDAMPSCMDVKMEFRYWEEGGEKTSVPLTPGKTLSLGAGLFSGEKTINMEIAVTPLNPIYGGEKVYSYVLYKTEAAFNKPVLKTLEVKNADGSEFEAPWGVLRSDNGEGVSYTQNSYYCYVPSDTDSVTISAAKIAGTSDITLSGETKEVSASAVSFAPINLTSGETTVVLSLSDGRDYSLRIIKTDDVNEVRTAYDSGIISVDMKSSAEKNVMFYIASYENDVLKSIEKTERTASPGDNSFYMNYPSVRNNNTMKLMIWDENLKPYSDAVTIK